MDELDQKLLSELQSRGYQKTAALSSILGAGERTIRRRISVMRSNGTIKVVAVPNPMLFGHRAWAKIGIKVEPKSLCSVASELVQHPSPYFVAYSLGTFDIMIAAHFDNMDRLTYFVNSELTKLKGISSTETIILTCPRKYYNFSWPAPLFRKTQDGWEHYDGAVSHDQYQADELDRRIVGALMEDGLARPADLKSKLGVGESSLRKRIKNMLRAGVYHIEVVPNPEVLEYEVWATMGITINNQFAHKVIDAIIKNQAVYLAAVSIGRFNVMISARFHNMDLLRRFVDMELPQIEGLGSVETFLHSKPLKYHNITWYHLINQ